SCCDERPREWPRPERRRQPRSSCVRACDDSPFALAEPTRSILGGGCHRGKRRRAAPDYWAVTIGPSVAVSQCSSTRPSTTRHWSYQIDVYFCPSLRGSSYSMRNTTPTMSPLVSTVTIGSVSLSQVAARGSPAKYATTLSRPDCTFGLCCR